MLKHHQETLSKSTDTLKTEPHVRGIIVGGSVAREIARADSDVDLMLVIDSGEFGLRRDQRNCTMLRYDLATYDGGYVDIKFVDVPFLQAAALRGSEPARDAFRGAYIAWTCEQGLGEFLARIPVYPEFERIPKIRSFYSQMLLQLYFFKHAGSDRFLLNRSADIMIFYASRLLLADARVLFPNSKRLMQTVAALPELPVCYLEMVDEVLASPSFDTARKFVDSINAFRDWGMDWDSALGQYTEDTELRWLDSVPMLSEW